MGDTIRIREPFENERPTAYADLLGQWYAPSCKAEHKKRFGQYLTSKPIADFMARLVTPTDKPTVRILDPGAGTGILASSLCEALSTKSRNLTAIQLTAYEIDEQCCNLLRRNLGYLKTWLGKRGIELAFEIVQKDFVLDNQDAAPQEYDVVISNPPYFKIRKSDKQAQALSFIVHGQPNIYPLFMMVSAMLLREGGELVFITPRSYTAGPYFRKFREEFFTRILPVAIHLFDSRDKAFSRDEVLQENVILKGRRMSTWQESSDAASTLIDISSSRGVGDLDEAKSRQVPVSRVIGWSTENKILHIPTSEKDEEVMWSVDSWPNTLESCGLKASTGPVVPFRNTEFLRHKGDEAVSSVPLFWMQNVSQMEVKWPLPHLGKEQYLEHSEKSRKKKLLHPRGNYVLIRRFSSKDDSRRLVAAPLLSELVSHEHIAFENHLNYIYRPGGVLGREEAVGLAAVYNSHILDSYFRIFNGNTQVSSTELMNMPLPPLDVIKEIGRKILNNPSLATTLNEWLPGDLNRRQ